MRISITLILFPIVLLGGDATVNDKLFIYEELSIQYLHTLVDQSFSNDKDVASSSMDELAYSSFLYWLNTRHGGSIKSARLDSFIRGGYIKLLESESIFNVKESFADPLRWKRDGKTFDVYSFESMTVQEYLVFTPEFISFLRGNERSKRD